MIMPLACAVAVGKVQRGIAICGSGVGASVTANKVADIITSAPEMLSEDSEIDEAAELMKSKQIRRLLITDAQGAYVGVLCLGDLAAEAHEQELCGQAMEEVCQPS